MTIRLQDIADDLNLSKMTISKVLRGQMDVSAETKARVLKRAQELNYRPNISARSLRTGQTHMVGLIVPNLEDLSIAGMCRGLIEVLRPANYAVVISSASDDPETEEREAELHLSRQVDALFLCGKDRPEDAPEALRNSPVPLLFLGRRPSRTLASSVTLRQGEVGRLAAEHLLSHGARRIAYLRGPRTMTGDERFSGYLEAHREASAAPRQDLVVEARPSATAHGATEYASAFEAVRAMLQLRSSPDAVMAHTDALAAGARDAALSHGLRVPDQFQVIGCGNDPMICSIGQGISSIDLCGEVIGVRAARLALKLIGKQSEEAPRSVSVSPRLVVRSTTREHRASVRRRKG